MKRIIITTICLFIVATISVNFAFASEEQPTEPDPPAAPSLQFFAVNAGYKDDSSSQNYDFIELSRTTTEDFSLTGFSLRYFNSSGSQVGEIIFSDNQVLTADHLVLGFSKSPQYADWSDTPYLYYFSSSGLASTAGKLQLLFNAEIIDEICWGKLDCASPNPKFATKFEDNYSLVRSDNNYMAQKYYPEIQPSITELITEEEPQECNLIITEIYTYYEDSASEQFIELYNPSFLEQDTSFCSFSYKNTPLLLTGNISPGAYFVYKNSEVVFTKNPTTYNIYSISDTDVILPHGQKKGTSYALFNIGTEDEQ